MNVVGCQIINARVRGVALHGCSVVRVADCTVRGRADDKSYRAAVSVDKTSEKVMLVNNFLGRGSDGELVIFDGVTRATRVAKYLPGTPITVEVTGQLKGPVGALPTVGEKV